MSDDESEDQDTRRLTVADRSVIDAANDLLKSLEQSHRADLPLHLYSSYLLKNLLNKANEKKHSYEIDQFIRTQIKDSWTSWPNPNTVIDPQSNMLYEDATESKQQTIIPGEISPDALTHSTNMLELELDSYWQHCLAQSAAISGKTLDIDRMKMPHDLTNSIVGKLDRFFNGLHIKLAAKNKFEIQQDQHSHQLTVSQLKHEKVKANKRIELSYHDIIGRGCEMGEDMLEIYMKSLELYNDIPSKFKKSQFKLPKSVLKKYSPSKKGKSRKEILERSREPYLEVEKLLKDKRLTCMDKMEVRKLTRKGTEHTLNKKTFYQVKGYKSDDYYQHKNDSNYSIEDCLVKIPRKFR